jgi:UDP-N-acetyl-D-glucosamine dehydrogenase
MRGYVVERVSDILNRDRIAVNGARILVIGAAYKADMGDVRESPALEVIELLAGKGADVCYHDPHVPELKIEGRPYKIADLTDERL